MIRPLKILVTVIIKNSTPEHHKWSPEAEEENHMSLGVIPLRLSAPGPVLRPVGIYGSSLSYETSKGSYVSKVDGGNF